MVLVTQNGTITFHCLVAGVVHIERFHAVERLPTKGETLMGKGVHFGVGGKGANSAVVARKMGAYVDFIVILYNKLSILFICIFIYRMH